MAAVINTFSLTKFYGQSRGIQAIELEVEKGEIFGFLGPNGAGKTTIIRLLLGLLKPTSGSSEIFGLNTLTESLEIRRRVGYISGDLSLFESMKGRGLINLLNSFHKNHSPRLDELALQLDLDLDGPIRAYSRGMKQKLAIIQALSHNPDLLILDEPTTGLDPLMQQQFYNIMRDFKAAGKTIFLSSHILPEVEHICDRIGIVKEGILIDVENVADLKRNKIRRLQIVLNRDVQAEDFDLEGVEILAIDGRKAEMVVRGHPKMILDHLSNLPIEDFVFPEASLEETFLQFYETGSPS